MKIEGVPFVTVDWQQIEPTVHRGETGEALWRTFEQGNIRVRMVEYSPGYRADHWCARGHVLLVLEGRLTTELKDGRIFELLPGTSYQPKMTTITRTDPGQIKELVFLSLISRAA